MVRRCHCRWRWLWLVVLVAGAEIVCWLVGCWLVLLELLKLFVSFDL